MRSSEMLEHIKESIAKEWGIDKEFLFGNTERVKTGAEVNKEYFMKMRGKK